MIPLLLVVALCTAASPTHANPLVDLGYAKYAGHQLSNTSTQWLGMRYAAPPLGALRFRPPVDPPITRRVQDASKFGNICLAQSPGDWTNEPNPRVEVGEDCLFVNVFAPAERGQRGRGRKVLFFVQGGGFVSNSNANFNGAYISILASPLARKALRPAGVETDREHLLMGSL